MAHMLLDLVSSLDNCLNCFPGSPTLKVNSRSFKILRLLGEGGFSYVYLVEDTASHQLLALKKIRCPFGAESVQQAMREVDAYRLFAHVPSIISAVDHAVATERGADEATKTVYILLPYYRRGNLQDMINANLVNRSAFPQRHLMMLFLGVCKALRAMHRYTPAPAERMRMGREEDVGDDDGDGDDDDDDDDDGGGGNGNSGSGRTTRRHDDDQQRSLMPASDNQLAGGKAQSFAHRDIKPGNIMIDDAGSTPILMDLGSVAPSPMAVSSQSVALQIQDTAAEHSTMPYRAPELFDVRPGTVVDTKSDIWSLGCTLYACLVGKSPFEMRSDETGGTLSLCVLGGDWRFPDESPAGSRRAATGISHAKAKAAAGAPDPKAPAPADSSAAASASASASGAPALAVSEPVRDIVRRCLRVEPAERPDVDELIAMVERVIDELPDDGGYASP